VRLVSAATVNLILKSEPSQMSSPKAQVTGRETVTVLLLAVSGRGVRVEPASPLADLLLSEETVSRQLEPLPGLSNVSLDDRQKLHPPMDVRSNLS
jgi:hypothetical protein